MKRNKITCVSLIFLLLLTLSLFGCSSQNSDNRNKTTGDAAGTNEGYKDTAPVTSTGTSSKTQSNAAQDRKVIFTASLAIETTHYDNSIAVLEKMIEDFGGYIQNSSVETSTSYQNSTKLRNATYTIRIPSDKLKSFLSKSGDIGNIILNTTQGEDVTDQFFDTQAHIDALTIQETRLLELLKAATSLKDILDLEDRISKVRYEIEQLTGTLNKLSSLIDLSTVTVKITEVETISTPEPEGFWAQLSSTFSKSIEALVRTLRVLSLVLVAIFPFLVVFGIVFLAIFLVYRRATRKKRLAAKLYRQNVLSSPPYVPMNNRNIPGSSADTPTDNADTPKNP